MKNSGVLSDIEYLPYQVWADVLDVLAEHWQEFSPGQQRPVEKAQA